jgi:hypothetical protein
MMMIAHLDTEAANEAVRSGKLGTDIQQLLGDLKPEAAYFATDNEGRRTAMVVFDMKDSSEMPAAAEGLFLHYKAAVTFRPCMNAQDLAAGAPGMERAVKFR